MSILRFKLAGSEENITLDQLKEKSNDCELLDVLKGGKMSISWPNDPPPPSGEVRYKLIHDRIRKMKADDAIEKLPKGKILIASEYFALILTLIAIPPFVYYALVKLGVESEKAKIAAAVVTLVSFFAELGLMIIRQWKKEQQEKRQRQAIKVKTD